MSTGINNTVKWTLTDGELVIEPVNGVSGVARAGALTTTLFSFCTGMTDSEWDSVRHIVYEDSVAFEVKRIGGGYDRIMPTITYSVFSPNTNVETVDVSGLNTVGVESFYWAFAGAVNLVSVIGLDNLNTSSVTKYDYMFTRTSLSIIDISNFENLDVSTTIVGLMFDQNPYLQTVALPTNFNLKRAYEVSGTDQYYFGIASSRIPATKDGVTISSDEDFFKLTATSQGGTWVRDISGSAELKFNVNKVVRDGNSAEMQYTYYASSATAEVYLKETNQSSFPSTPSDTFSIEGTGTGSRTLTLASDSAYDVMVKVYDGETTLYTYPSIDSNVLLFSVDENGNVWAGGDMEDGQGNVLADKADTSALLNLMVTESKSLGSVEIPANGVRSVSANVEKSGYTPLGIVGVTKTGSNNGDAVVSTFNVSGTTATVSLRNQGSATRTPSVTAKILYIKTL